MAENQIRFDDGAAYERMMGTWSRLVGKDFLDWLAPRPGLRWIDIGCGNGAFTELVIERCSPAAVLGIDPSEGQLAFARGRPAARMAEFRRGDAMALPISEGTFDVAIMALVIFFVPDPVRGVTEMVRVVRPGGTVATYVWDMLGGGVPLEAIQIEMRAMGVTPLLPPNSSVSRMEALRDLWTGAGLDAIETREITVRRTFANFEDLWTTSMGSSVGPTVAAMPAADSELLKERVRTRLRPDAAGRITYGARANAIKGYVPT
jgi:ubiquinone/menaquinone biosynthesis C-methylase UbiE